MRAKWSVLCLVWNVRVCLRVEGLQPPVHQYSCHTFTKNTWSCSEKEPSEPDLLSEVCDTDKCDRSSSFRRQTPLADSDFALHRSNLGCQRGTQTPPEFTQTCQWLRGRLKGTSRLLQPDKKVLTTFTLTKNFQSGTWHFWTHRCLLPVF